MERKLGETSSGTSNIISEYVYEIPLLLSLTQLLSDEFIMEEVS